MASHTSKFEAMPLMEKDEDWEDQDDLVLGPLNSVLENMKYNSRTISRSEFWKVILFASTLSFVAGVTVPYIFYSLLFNHCPPDMSHMKTSVNISQSIISEIKEDRIKSCHMKLQELNSSALSLHIKEQWEKQGLDKVAVVSHNVVISLPSKKRISKLYVIKENVKEMRLRRSGLNVDENSSYIKPLCYASGVATIHPIEGDLVFANFGRYEDFLTLSKLNIVINGNIIAMKYGMTPTYNKVLLALELGAKGVILFPSSPTGFKNNNVTNMSCNILLPEEKMHSYPTSDQFLFQKIDLPVIPVYPIMSEDAEELLRMLGGPREPDEWNTGESSHNVGPGFLDKDRKVRMELFAEDVNQTVYSVLGKLQGEAESDHSVVVGSVNRGRNATGLSILLEISQVLSKFIKNGIRPRRNILFCVWEPGSYLATESIHEWIKDHLEYLETEAVAYIDVSVSPADLYQFISTPVLEKELTETMQKVLVHREQDTNIFSIQQPNSTLNNQGKSRFQFRHVKGSMPFHDILGVQSAYLQHDCKPPVSCQYMTDCNINCCTRDGAADFHNSLTLAQIWTSVIHSLSHSQILNFDIAALATYLSTSIKELEEKYGKLLEENSISWSKLNDSVEEFAKAVNHFHKSIENVDGKSLYAIRNANNKLLRIGRSFIDTDCTSKKSTRRNILFAPSSIVACSMVAFPEVMDLLMISEIENGGEHTQMNKDLQDKISVVISHIKSAIKILDNEILS